MKYLIFLGAGASRPFGIPTMQEMVDEFEKYLKENNRKEFQLYEKIKKIQIEGYGYSKVDIESIFSVIQGISSNIILKEMGHLPYYVMASSFLKHEFNYDTIEDARSLKQELEKFIKEKCESHMVVKERLKIYEQSYTPLFSSLLSEASSGANVFSNGEPNGFTWRAYTTNYDTIFEEFWSDRVILDDYFDNYGESAHKIFSINKIPRPHKTLIKLHGSIDWIREKAGNILKIGTKYTSLQLEGEVMVFPIQQKDLYMHPWITLFQDLKKALRELHTWIVIGYAFNDEFILDVFDEALSSENKKLIIINPSAKDIVQKFSKNNQDKIISLPIKFGDAYFSKQISDFFKKIRTFDIRIRTKSAGIGFNSSFPIQSLSFETSKGIVNKSSKGDHEMYIPLPSARDVNEVIKCTLVVTFDYPFEKDLELRYICNTIDSANVSVYINDRIITSTEVIPKGSSTHPYHTSEPIKIRSDQLFVRT